MMANSTRAMSCDREPSANEARAARRCRDHPARTHPRSPPAHFYILDRSPVAGLAEIRGNAMGGTSIRSTNYEFRNESGLDRPGPGKGMTLGAR